MNALTAQKACMNCGTLPIIICPKQNAGPIPKPSWILAQQSVKKNHSVAFAQCQTFARLTRVSYKTPSPFAKKKRPVSEFIISCHVYRNSQKEYGLIQRPCSGIWQDLLFFPPSAKKGNQSIKQTHLLTHRKLEISYEIQHTEPLGITHWLTKEQLLHSAIPNALRRVIGEIDHVFNLGDSV